MRRAILILPLLLSLGCASKADLEKALADSKSLSAEKDSLITEVLETSKFVNSINEELSRARTALVAPTATTDAGTPAERDRAARAAALERVQSLVTRLNETEQRLEQSTARARGLSGQNRGLIAQINAYKVSIDSLQASALRTETELRGVIDSQNVRITAMGEQLDTANAVNARMSESQAVLTDSVAQLTQYKNTVYYVAGTEDELLKQGVITKEGKKFLFFGGKQLHPARDLDPSKFTPLDRSRQTEIVLPHPEATYRMVSRQDLAYVDSSAVRDGNVTGTLRISSPDAFWAPSRFLILVEN
jgi:hypothetical protein